MPHVPASGSRFKRRGQTTDHWHRTETDPGRPYDFKDAETLIEDFFDEVERVARPWDWPAGHENGSITEAEMKHVKVTGSAVRRFSKFSFFFAAAQGW